MPSAAALRSWCLVSMCYEGLGDFRVYEGLGFRVYEGLGFRVYEGFGFRVYEGLGFRVSDL